MSSQLLVISGPSGVGKGTVVKNLLSRYENFTVSVSATTRAPREGEVDGQDYFFLSDEQFEEMVKKGQMLEHAIVHGKHRYGTPKGPVLEALQLGKSVILEIDVQGALQVRESYPEAKLIFISAPSIEELAARLAGRNTESVQEQELRMNTARAELAQSNLFDYVLVNENVSDCADEVVKLSSN
jgi:guanylate kinase